MSFSSWQAHITQITPDVTELVDLLKLPDRRGSLQLVIDGECCLDRLYGGYYPDWVCGGQWNKMDQFLCNFSSVVQNSQLDLIVFLNGSLETERLNDWCKRQEVTYKFVQEIHQHISMKRKPPPKIWWIPPAFLRSAIRLACRCLNMKIMCSLEDHHKEIVQFVKKNRISGIIADDSEYLLFEPDRYFSAQKLKLTFKGSLETIEMKLTKVYSALNVPKDRLHIVATLLGNHIVPENDLTFFYSALSISERQETVAVIEAVSQFVRSLEATDHGDVVDLILEKSRSELTNESLEKLRGNLFRSLKYYGTIPGKNSTNGRASHRGSQMKKDKSFQKINESEINGSSTVVPETSNAGATISILPSDGQSLVGSLNGDTNVFEDGNLVDGAIGLTDSVTKAVDPKLTPSTNGSGDAPPAKNKPKEESSLVKLMYRVAPQIDNVATSRHRAGLMSPFICQILKYKEIKLPVLIEDINEHELPQTHMVFRPLRQRVYAILFNLHHLHFLAKERGEAVPKIEVKETYYDPVTKKSKTDVIRAIEIGWGVPTVERLWLGDGDECKRKRVRAFLSTLKSDNQIFLNDSIVPQHFLVLCCVLRYLLHDKKILREIELDALIAQALIQRLTDVNVAQDIEVSNLTMRGIHISHMFMEGIEMALLVNDACGSPIPYMLFAPWLFFNGKIFNFILEEQVAGKTIAEICGFKMEIVLEMGRMKTAIMDGINVHFFPNPYVSDTNVPLLNAMLQGQFGRIPCQFTQGYVPNSMRGINVPVRRNAGGLGANPGALRNSGYLGPVSRGIPQFEPEAVSYSYDTPRVARYHDAFMEDHGRVDRRGFGGGRSVQLEVAGTVVGSWGANYTQPSNPRHQPQGFYGFSTTHANSVRRNPFGLTHDRSSNISMDTAFRQLRISPGNKVPNRGNSNWNTRGDSTLQQKQQQKKSIMKNNETVLPTLNKSSDDIPVVAGSSKAKVVSFVEEPNSIASFPNAETDSGLTE